MPRSEAHPHERRQAPLARTMLTVLFGPIVWAMHFAVLYGTHTIVCARATTGDAATTTALAATVAALALLLAGAVAAYRRRDARHDASAVARFCRDVMLLLTLLSACGVAWAGATALLVAPCPAFT
jgi:hypothetical protein